MELEPVTELTVLTVLTVLTGLTVLLEAILILFTQVLIIKDSQH